MGLATDLHERRISAALTLAKVPAPLRDCGFLRVADWHCDCGFLRVATGMVRASCDWGCGVSATAAWHESSCPRPCCDHSSLLKPRSSGSPSCPRSSKIGAWVTVICATFPRLRLLAQSVALEI